jgi:TonB family protein
MIVAIASALLVAQAGAAPAGQSQVVPPAWLRKPTVDDLMRVYPRDALRHNVWGAAVVSCQVTEKGELSGCQVLQESPPNEGFGEAALKLMPRFLMRPPTRSGIPVGGGTVTVPIRFHFSRSPQKPPPPRTSPPCPRFLRLERRPAARTSIPVNGACRERQAEFVLGVEATAQGASPWLRAAIA